ncbi:MAG TPA: hypothetical protein PKG56_03070 [Chitinophagaceae bacterium]|nr:hypothetical protein [Chitinophagaceae bacterium]MCC6634185.1 hypothetical protein [Chitinophagaceae bacterium]HMZ45970.1 hypothetical protein [Chitinophagaceae bacterium]HNE92630.1 hypothetical protein [Chitinophagaceae bacterium]HNF28671.1 hypothetical protein [Chitinophagaceae bacterium]
MSHSHFEGDSKKFTLTAILSFAIVFCFLALFSRCNGDYKTDKSAGSHTPATKEHKAH